MPRQTPRQGKKPRRGGAKAKNRSVRTSEARTKAPSGASAGTQEGNWIYGWHSVLAALNNPARRCQRLLLTEKALTALEKRATGTKAPASGLPEGAPKPEILPRPDLDRLLPEGAAHQGLLLAAEALTPPTLDEACAIEGARDDGDRAIAVVLDQVTDPRNVGAILRSAAAFGARAVITTKSHAPPPVGALAKAASGALEVVPYLRLTNLARALDELADLGYWRLGLEATAAESLSGGASEGPVALVLGAEGSGLRRLSAEHCDALVRLPITAGLPESMPSLNVSNAAAVALYELAREA